MFGTRKPKPILRPIEIQYFPSGRGWGRPICKGFTTSVSAAMGIAARHIARLDWYPRAVIIDREKGIIVCKMWLTSEGIRIEETVQPRR
jgi:hypothetical protein